MYEPVKCGIEPDMWLCVTLHTANWYKVASLSTLHTPLGVPSHTTPIQHGPHARALLALRPLPKLMISQDSSFYSHLMQLYIIPDVTPQNM